MKKITLLLNLILISFTNCVGQNSQDVHKVKNKYNFTKPDSVCPPEGNAKDEKKRESNKLKNRNQFPEEKNFDTNITLGNILKPGNDKTRWDNTKAVRITGYIYDVKQAGPESCNCKTKNKYLQDTHIEIISDPMNDGKIKRFVVEVTPRLREIMRLQKINWSTNVLRDKFLGRWVQIEGWMFFDEEHADESENTNPGREKNWRATSWEIHPVTKMEVVERPR